MKKIITSHAFKVVLYVLGGFVVLLFVFQAGMFVGFRKADFSDKIGENYFREMSGEKRNPLDVRGDDLSNTHGAIGQIIELKLPLIVVEDTGVDKVISIGSSTLIRGTDGTKTASDLKLDDFVTVFGSDPDANSVIAAHLVRIMPPPTNTFASTSTNK